MHRPLAAAGLALQPSIMTFLVLVPPLEQSAG